MADAQLPSGTVTFLFTDLVDSTHLWEQQSDAMRVAVADHDAILAEIVTREGGCVVKFQGDGLMAVFDDADAAVRAAVDGQRRIREATGTIALGVRMGLCTGSARERDGDYHGPVVNRAARITAAAHPGQIVLAPTTAALVETAALRDLGEYRLKGLPPLRLAQVLDDDLASEFPPLIASRVGFDLAPATSFVGRLQELDTIRRLASSHVFVSLTGAGGCGKTRLALEVARCMSADFADGIRFADLTTIADDDVAGAVAGALGLADDIGQTDPVERIATHLRDRTILCILDNCEHLLDACAALAEAVIARAGKSRVIATSREPLGVAGEQIVLVPSLDPRSEAVELFAARAAEARAGFTVDAGNTEVVAQICERLDGIPLAIELGAAQVNRLAPAQLLELLSGRFDVLTGGRRRVPRQQTLAATLEWSHDLLNDAERVTFRRLAVFPSTFSSEAAEAVAGLDAVELGSLVTKSLVQVIDDGDRFRYRLLETVRAYAYDKLVAAAEVDDLRARHARWVADELESLPLIARWFGDDADFVDLHDVRAALEWSTRSGATVLTARIASGINWNRYDQWREGIRWCEAAMESTSLDARTRLQVLLMLQLTRMSDLSLSMFDLADEAEMAADALEDPLVALMWVLRWSPTMAEVTGDKELAERFAECAEVGVSMSDAFSPPWQIYCRLLTGAGYRIIGREEAATRHFEAIVARSEVVEGYDAIIGSARGCLALRYVLDGDLDRARTLADGVVEVPYVSLEVRQGAMDALLSNAADGDVASTRRGLRSYYEDCLRSDLPQGVESMLVYAAGAAGLNGDWVRAARLIGASRQGFRRSPDAYLLYRTFRDRAREQLGAVRFQRCRDEGRLMSRDDAVALGLAES